MADLMPMELWAMTLSNLDYKDLRRCMRVSKFFQSLTQEPRLRSTLFRGTVISTLTSYYQFLITMYLPESEVLYPPPGGWPMIRSVPYRPDDVTEILRHIPYLPDHHPGDSAQIFDATVAVDFREKHPCEADLESVDVPPCAFTLARPSESEGQYIYLDTEHETVTLYGFPNGAWRNRSGQVPLVPEGPNQKWRDFMNEEDTYKVPVLFEKFKEEFRNLVAVPIEDHCKVRSDSMGLGSNNEEEKEIFRKHGWPSTDYNKAACMAELSAYAEEKWRLRTIGKQAAVQASP